MISVIIPTFNRAKVLPRAIESVVNQSFKDWELIIIDDGSKDDTHTVVERYLKHYSNIFYHYYLNMGASVARNIGVSLSKGDLIAFLDSDDVWTPGRLSLIEDTYSNSRNREKFFFTDFRSNLNSESLFKKEYLSNENFFQNLLAINFLGGTSNLIAPRDILSSINGFDPLLTSTEDHEIYVRLAKQYSIEYIPGEDAIYFLDTQNRISSKNNRRLVGQLAYYKKHKNKMSFLTKLLVMKKNALLAHYIKSPIFFKYILAWAAVWLLKKIYRIQNEMDFFTVNSKFLRILRRM